MTQITSRRLTALLHFNLWFVFFFDLLSVIADRVIVGSGYGQFPAFADADEPQNLIMHRCVEGQGLTVRVGVIVRAFVRRVYAAKDGEK